MIKQIQWQSGKQEISREQNHEKIAGFSQARLLIVTIILTYARSYIDQFAYMHLHDGRIFDC